MRLTSLDYAPPDQNRRQVAAHIISILFNHSKAIGNSEIDGGKSKEFEKKTGVVVVAHVHHIVNGKRCQARACEREDEPPNNPEQINHDRDFQSRIQFVQKDDELRREDQQHCQGNASKPERLPEVISQPEIGDSLQQRCNGQESDPSENEGKQNCQSLQGLNDAIDSQGDCEQFSGILPLADPGNHQIAVKEKDPCGKWKYHEEHQTEKPDECIAKLWNVPAPMQFVDGGR